MIRYIAFQRHIYEELINFYVTLTLSVKKIKITFSMELTC